MLGSERFRADVGVVLLVEALVEERDMQDAMANVEQQIIKEEVEDELAAYDGGARNGPRRNHIRPTIDRTQAWTGNQQHKKRASHRMCDGLLY